MLELCLNKEVSWANYLKNGEITNSLIIIVTYFFVQQMLLIYVPSKWTSSDPNFVPNYKLNGFSCFVCNLILGLLMFPFLGFGYQIFDSLVLTLEWIAWLCCIFVYIKAKLYPTTLSPRSETGIIFYDFISGIERYPEINGYQLKQIFNCRFGMMGWLTIILSCLSYSYYHYGYISNGLLASSLLQIIYIGKFFHWEEHYFNTIDIAFDHLGFYILWGVMFCVPSFYTLTTIYLTNRPELHPSDLATCVILLLGMFSIYLNYDADYQKTLARNQNIENRKIWNQDIKTLKMKYVVDGVEKESIFCLSGWWGFSRHFHYIPELLSCFMWSVVAGDISQHWIAYVYFIYLSMLLLHRIFRDEEKCALKYGPCYEEYIKLVPYRLIKYVW
jgi:7-dehydrocholesterol reductase